MITLFSNLSEPAQELIVNAVMGVYDKTGAPEIDPAIKEEIRVWAETNEK